jgi:hypothetical protein
VKMAKAVVVTNASAFLDLDCVKSYLHPAD